MRHVRILAALLLAVFGLGSSAWAQDDFLFWSFDPGADAITGAINELELRGPRVFSADTFIFELHRQDWPLVIIRRYDAPEPGLEREIIDLLEAHLARGGRLLVNFAELDEMPDMQRFLGLDGAVDIEEPLRDVRNSMVPLHPAAAHGFMRVSFEPIGPDFGDVLVPGSDHKTIYIFDDAARSPASVLSRDGQVIVNGWEWAEWSLGDGIGIATEQLRWLTSCPADLDGSGSLDLFDFLEFQRLFDAGDPAADWFDYDGELTVFDFLAFLNAFETGCP